jgi:hypothetical protein
MVNRWRCRHCEFTVWSASGEETVSSVKSHIMEHHTGQLTDDGFQIHWNCPYCEEGGDHHDEEQGIQTFQNHLFEHVQPLMESDTHVADEISGTGDVLVLGALESTGADNARIHFLAPADIAIFVTSNPARRLRLLHEEMQQWPSATVVITTNDKPLEGLEDLDFTNVPIEVVKLDKRLGLGGLGETISRVVEEHESTKRKLSVEFDILAEIISTFNLEEVFKFLHALTARLERANALSHYYFDPQSRSESTINVLDQIFDVRITANGNTFVTEPRPELQ